MGRTAGARAQRRPLRWLAKLLLLFVSVALSLGVLEIVLRAMGQRALYELYSKPSLFWHYDPLLGWSHEPGSRGRYVGPRPWPVEFDAEVAINSVGLRGPEVPPRAPGELRILFLGDSVVAGFEVPYEQTYVARTEHLLGQRLGRTVRTINAGVRGYGSDQSYLYYRERGRKLEPDLVVFQQSRNDPLDNMTLHEMRRPFGKTALRPLPDGTLQLVNFPVPHYESCSEVSLIGDYQAERIDGPLGRLLCRAQMLLFDHSALFSLVTIAVPWDGTLLRALYYLGNPHGARSGTHPEVEADLAGRLTLRIVEALAKAVEQDGRAFVLIGEPTDLTDAQMQELQGQGIAVERILSLLDKSQDEVRWRHDSHYNSEGHRLVAEELAAKLEPRLREIIQKRERAS